MSGQRSSSSVRWWRDDQTWWNGSKPRAPKWKPHLVTSDTRQLCRMEVKSLAREIDKTQSAIRDVVGEEPCYFRPPGGVVKGARRVYRAEPLSMVLWGQSTHATGRSRFALPTIRKRARAGLKQTNPVILLHDGGSSRSQTARALVGISLITKPTATSSSPFRAFDKSASNAFKKHVSLIPRIAPTRSRLPASTPRQHPLRRDARGPNRLRRTADFLASQADQRRSPTIQLDRGM